MKKIITLIFTSALFVSCSNTPKEVVVEEQQHIKIKTIDENGLEKIIEWNGEGAMPEEIKAAMQTAGDSLQAGLAIAHLSIEGMSCAKMCASSIDKALNALEGIEKASVDFEQKLATVEFDDQKLSHENIVKAIHDVHDGKYKVTQIELKKELEKAL